MRYGSRTFNEIQVHITIPYIEDSFQARLGDMDGIFICFHNTTEAFGFRYMTISEMDDLVYGNSEFAEKMFGVLVRLFESILDRIRSDFDSVVSNFYSLDN